MNKKKITVRASSVPLLIDCNQSRLGSVDIDEKSEAAVVGTMIHEVAGQFLSSRQMPPLEEFCEKHSLKLDSDIEFLARGVVMAWNAISPSFPDPLVERHLRAKLYEDDELEIWISGHVDMISVGANQIRIGDWKTGRKRKDFRGQVLAYALLAHLTYKMDAVNATVIWLRFGEWDTTRFAKGEFKWMTEEIVRAVKAPGMFKTGDHCLFCPRFYECPAREAMTEDTLITLTQGIDCDKHLGDLSPARFEYLRAGAKTVTKLVAKFDEFVKAEIKKAGSMKLPDGKQLILADRRRRVLLPQKAWPVLKNYVSEQQMGDIVTMTLGKAERAVKDNVPRGDRGLTWGTCLEELDDAGAIDKVEYKQLDVVDQAEEIDA